jgi:hypothetical protein
LSDSFSSDSRWVGDSISTLIVADAAVAAVAVSGLGGGAAWIVSGFGAAVFAGFADALGLAARFFGEAALVAVLESVIQISSTWPQLCRGRGPPHPSVPPHDVIRAGHMNGCWAKYSSLAVAAVALGGVGAGIARADPAAKPTSPITAGALEDAAKPAQRPNFVDIPAAPKDIRPIQAWQASIADTKAVGVKTAAEANAGPWTLSGTQAWVDRAIAQANPPPPMTKPADANTDAFVRDMLRRATPPPRAH